MVLGPDHILQPDRRRDTHSRGSGRDLPTWIPFNNWQFEQTKRENKMKWPPTNFLVTWLKGKLTIIGILAISAAAIVGGILLFGSPPGVVGEPEIDPEGIVEPETIQEGGKDGTEEPDLQNEFETVAIPSVEGMEFLEALI